MVVTAANNRNAYSCDREGMVPSINGRETMLRELSALEMDLVSGGMMNDGRGQLDPKAPGALPERGRGGPPNGTNLAPVESLMGGILLLAAII